MSQFTRKKLSRGVKLLIEHIFDPATAIATALSSSNIETQSIRDDKTSFRVTISIPQLSGYHMFQWKPAAPYADADGTRPFCFPFAIPQPQETFQATGKMDSRTVGFSLDEVSVSFDQAGENSAICAFGNAAGYEEGNHSHNDARHLDIKLAIVEKTMKGVDTTAGYDPDREVFSGLLKAESFSGQFLRLNPFVFPKLNKSLHPYKSLMLCVDCDGLRPPSGQADATNHYLTLPAFTVSMKFRCDRVARDTSGDNVQNLPAHLGNATNDSVIVSPPGANNPIEADNSGGVDNETAILDAKLQGRLWSGYTKQGDVSGVDHFAKDSGLEVIAVPLWSNFGERGRMNGTTAPDAVWKGIAPYDGPICDERWIPIGYPFTIHHCILALNYSSGRGGGSAFPLIGGMKPASPTYISKLGVAMVSGFHADHMAYQQVAYLGYTAATLQNHTIDQIRHNQRQSLTGFDYVCDMVQVPLVNPGGVPGVGYNNILGAAIAQGPPVFVGKGASTRTTEGRSQIGDYLGVAGDPTTAGGEQYLCVRQSFEDSAGLGATNPAVGDNDTYVGVGGHMLYIIGKKTVVGGREPAMTAGR